MNNEKQCCTSGTTGEIMSLWKWFWTIFVLVIPVVNIIMLIVWACCGNANRKNYCRAVILWSIICIAIGITLTYFVKLPESCSQKFFISLQQEKPK